MYNPARSYSSLINWVSKDYTVIISTPKFNIRAEPIILQIKARVLFCGEGPHSRCYGRTAAMKLILQPCDEDDLVFPCNGAPVEWNWQGKTEILGGKTCPSATLSTTNPTWTDPGSNPGPRGERPATNRLNHGTATTRALRHIKQWG